MGEASEVQGLGADRILPKFREGQGSTHQPANRQGDHWREPRKPVNQGAGVLEGPAMDRPTTKVRSGGMKSSGEGC